MPSTSRPRITAYVIGLCLLGVACTGSPQARLLEPFDVIERDDGSILIAERRANAIRVIDPITGASRVVAHIDAPRDIETNSDGRLLVASNRQIRSLDLATGLSEQILSAPEVILGFATTADGALYASVGGTTVIRRERDGSTGVVANGLDGVHGLLALPDGSVLLMESYAGNIRRLDPATHRTSILTSKLGNPAYAVRTRDGAIYVTEFSKSAVTRLYLDGTTELIASVPSPNGVAGARDGSLLIVTMPGRLWRVDPRTRVARRADS
jgi:sugar lactone lactonase YvrE